ncbi:MAG: HEAT repeat domain-containing protein [Planctomycetaceae bacterium]|nr:HEAT repeat domain-containing protein [Planctomycetaceae bacterium]
MSLRRLLRTLAVVCPIFACLLLNGLTPSARAALKSTKVPRFDTAVAKAVQYITGNADKINERDKTLAAYALLKAGVELTNPVIVEGLKLANERAESGGYARVGYDHIYFSGVDSMLLADSEPDRYFDSLQKIAGYVQSVQRADGSWSDSPSAAGDVSMSQYGVLALWSAQRAGCTLNPESLDRAASFFQKGQRGDGGWPYRPGTSAGLGSGNSTHNMTMAAVGSVAVSRTLLHGPKGFKKQVEEPQAKFGILEAVESEAEKNARTGSAFPDYNASSSASALDGIADRGLGWNQSHFEPVSKSVYPIYYYYGLERASALMDLAPGWFETYGDGLLTFQSDDGSFKTRAGEIAGTALAILYFMRSTQQILDKQYGAGLLQAGRGLDNLFGQKEKKKKEIGPLDELLKAMETANFDELENFDADEIVERIQFSSPEELVGQTDLLKKLMKHPDPSNRAAACYALGRTGDFSLIPMMLQALRDPSLDVNVEALQALRYIARKPNGLGIPLDPLAGPEVTSEDQKLVRANNWRTKAYQTWSQWYSTVRPFSEQGGLDELEALTGTGN